MSNVIRVNFTPVGWNDNYVRYEYNKVGGFRDTKIVDVHRLTRKSTIRDKYRYIDMKGK